MRRLTFESYLNNNLPPSLVVIYPGRFQPAHKNHAATYNYLVNKFPYADVYIATSGTVKLPKSPFTFEEKKVMLEAAGVPANKIIKTKNPYQAVDKDKNPTEILQHYNLSTTPVIFAVGSKDMQADAPRFNFLPTKSGGEAYFKPLKNIDNITVEDVKSLYTADKFGYVATTPTFKFSLNLTGAPIPITGASEIRELYKTSSELGKKEIISQLYGDYNEQIYNIFNNRLL